MRIDLPQPLCVAVCCSVLRCVAAESLTAPPLMRLDVAPLFAHTLVVEMIVA